MLVVQSYLTLCNPIDGSPPGPSVHGILQARTLEWVAISFSKRNNRKKESEVTQSCPTLCDPTDCSLPGSCIHGIFQARVLECGAIAFSIKWVFLSFSPLLFAFLLFTAICKASSDNHFAVSHFFFLGMVLIPVSCTMS